MPGAHCGGEEAAQRHAPRGSAADHQRLPRDQGRRAQLGRGRPRRRERLRPRRGAAALGASLGAAALAATAGSLRGSVFAAPAGAGGTGGVASFATETAGLLPGCAGAPAAGRATISSRSGCACGKTWAGFASAAGGAGGRTGFDAGDPPSSAGSTRNGGKLSAAESPPYKPRVKIRASRAEACIFAFLFLFAAAPQGRALRHQW